MFVSTFLQPWRDLLIVDEDSRRPGYIGHIPYTLVLRWIVVLSIFLRWRLHALEYARQSLIVYASFWSSLLLAIILTAWRPRWRSQWHGRTKNNAVFFVIVLDI